MVDQAEALRQLFRERMTGGAVEFRSPDVFTLAVTSGKGGVGKTTIAVNLALLLAAAGRRVRLFDADFGLSNAEVLLGVRSHTALCDVMRGRAPASEAWIDAPGGIKLLTSGAGLHEMADLDGAMGAELIGHALRSSSDGDVLIIDTAPGISAGVVSLLAFANEIMLVTTPEPTSIADTYAALKVLSTFTPDADITLVVNSCADPAQAAQVARGLDETCRRFLTGSFQRHCCVPSDPTVGEAVRTQRPLACRWPRSLATAWLRKVAIGADERIRRRKTPSQPSPEGAGSEIPPPLARGSGERRSKAGTQCR